MPGRGLQEMPGFLDITFTQKSDHSQIMGKVLAETSLASVNDPIIIDITAESSHLRLPGHPYEPVLPHESYRP
jgi:hypothetical protein